MDSETIAVYEGGAGRWVERRGEAKDDLALRLRSQIGDGLVLDAGCGTGRHLGQIGRPAVGIDATEAMLTFARRHDMPLVRGDLEHLPFVTASFRGIFARHSYLHVPKRRLGHALAEAARVLEPAGVLFLSMIRGNYEGRALPGDDIPGRWFSLWDGPELAAALITAGFIDLRVVQVKSNSGAELEVTGFKS